MIEGMATAACRPYARPMEGMTVRKKGLRKLVAVRREVRIVMIVCLGVGDRGVVEVDCKSVKSPVLFPYLISLACVQERGLHD